MPIYKILMPAEWDEFEARGRFEGSTFDASSGFVHCSSREQVPGTARRYFADVPELVVVALDENRLDDVRWEVASDGGTFPHVYGPLTRDSVLAVHRLPGAGAVDVLEGMPDVE